MSEKKHKERRRRERAKKEEPKVNKISDVKMAYIMYGKKVFVIPIVIAIILGAIIWGIVYNTRKNNAPQETADNQKEQINYIWGEIKPGKKNTNNYTMVTSSDGIQVPVPTGYTASSVKDETYVGCKIEKVTNTWYSQDITNTLSSSGTYPWSKNSNGIWVSGNYQKSNSTSEMTTSSFTVGAKGGKVKLNWSVSSEGNFDKLYGQIINTSTGSVVATTEKLSGTSNGTTESSLKYVDTEKGLEQGTYQLKIIYSKDGSGNSGLDKAYVKKVEIYTENNTGGTSVTETTNKVIKTNEGGQNGFVIYEGTDAVTDSNKWEAQCNRNQYVWIPIADVSDMYWRNQTTGKKYGTTYTFLPSSYSKSSSNKNEPQTTVDDIQSTYLTQYLNGMSREDFLMEMEIDFDKMLNSVATYGGYYVGRYETGDLSQATPVIKRINTDITSQTWYTMWKKSPRISTGGANVHMIWGIQWDETVKWLIDTGEKTYAEIGPNSTSWGNYKNNSFTYYTNTSKSTATKSSETETRIPSGAYEGANANNVFDLAGNVWDWTCESYGSGTGYDRCRRGGCYGNGGHNGPAGYHGYYSPSVSNVYVGLRCALYVK